MFESSRLCGWSRVRAGVRTHRVFCMDLEGFFSKVFILENIQQKSSKNNEKDSRTPRLESGSVVGIFAPLD